MDHKYHLWHLWYKPKLSIDCYLWGAKLLVWVITRTLCLVLPIETLKNFLFSLMVYQFELWRCQPLLLRSLMDANFLVNRQILLLEGYLVHSLLSLLEKHRWYFVDEEVKDLFLSSFNFSLWRNELSLHHQACKTHFLVRLKALYQKSALNLKS